MEEFILEFLKTALSFGIVSLSIVVVILIYAWCVMLKEEGGIKLVIKWSIVLLSLGALSALVRLLIFK